MSLFTILIQIEGCCEVTNFCESRINLWRPNTNDRVPIVRIQPPQIFRVSEYSNGFHYITSASYTSLIIRTDEIPTAYYEGLGVSIFYFISFFFHSNFLNLLLKLYFSTFQITPRHRRHSWAPCACAQPETALNLPRFELHAVQLQLYPNTNKNQNERFENRYGHSIDWKIIFRI